MRGDETSKKDYSVTSPDKSVFRQTSLATDTQRSSDEIAGDVTENFKS